MVGYWALGRGYGSVGVGPLTLGMGLLVRDEGISSWK